MFSVSVSCPVSVNHNSFQFNRYNELAEPVFLFCFLQSACKQKSAIDWSGLENVQSSVYSVRYWISMFRIRNIVQILLSVKLWAPFVMHDH